MYKRNEFRGMYIYLRKISRGNNGENGSQLLYLLTNIFIYVPYNRGM